MGARISIRRHLAKVAREVCAIEVEPDGMAFDPATVVPERINEDADYEGHSLAMLRRIGAGTVCVETLKLSRSTIMRHWPRSALPLQPLANLWGR